MKDVEREARRVAAAFGAETFEAVSLEPRSFVHFQKVGRVLSRMALDFEGISGDTPLSWTLDAESGELLSVEIGPLGDRDQCELYLGEAYSAPSEWHLHLQKPFATKLAYGLYCLGFEDEAVLAKLNQPLSHHEQMELRLSLSREFWPQQWTEETPK
ncbi:hypothetical protein IAD21_05064 [Abditibacteriota bacterium]|nr:hypothetical protein IAD21_05064 [Abditibacteriota bacterium]